MTANVLWFGLGVCLGALLGVSVILVVILGVGRKAEMGPGQTCHDANYEHITEAKDQKADIGSDT